MGHLARLDVRHKALPCRTVKVAAGPPIVCIVDDIGVAPLCCIAFEITFLVQNGVRVAREVIVTGQALIERSDFSSVCLFAISGAPFRRTAHLWQFHYTTFRLVCQPVIADQPQNFIFHRFLGGFAEVDTNFIGGVANVPGQKHGVLSAIEPLFLALSAHPVYTVVIVPLFVTCDCVTSFCVKPEHGESPLSPV